MATYSPTYSACLSLPVMAAVSLCLAGFIQPACTAEPPLSDNAAHTLDGKTVFPLRSKESKLSVLIYITTDCPIANALTPEINRIYQHYHKQGVQFTLVHVDPDIDLTAAKKHAREYSLEAPVVIDRKHQLVKAGKAKVTPQVAVFDHHSKLIYTGRINDQWADYGQRRAKAREHNLRDTLEALLNGKPAPKSSATAIGCFIPDIE